MDYIYTYDDSEIDMSESLNDLGANDGYHGPDTEDEIPDPNLSPIALYQDTNKPPKPLEKRHFQEGIIYGLTLKTDRDVSDLGMIILVTDKSILFRVLLHKVLHEERIMTVRLIRSLRSIKFRNCNTSRKRELVKR